MRRYCPWISLTLSNAIVFIRSTAAWPRRRWCRRKYSDAAILQSANATSSIRSIDSTRSTHRNSNSPSSSKSAFLPVLPAFTRRVSRTRVGWRGQPDSTIFLTGSISSLSSSGFACTAAGLPGVHGPLSSFLFFSPSRYSSSTCVVSMAVGGSVGAAPRSRWGKSLPEWRRQCGAVWMPCRMKSTISSSEGEQQNRGSVSSDERRGTNRLPENPPATRSFSAADSPSSSSPTVEGEEKAAVAATAASVLELLEATPLKTTPTTGARSRAKGRNSEDKQEASRKKNDADTTTRSEETEFTATTTRKGKTRSKSRIGKKRTALPQNEESKKRSSAVARASSLTTTTSTPDTTTTEAPQQGGPVSSTGTRREADAHSSLSSSMAPAPVTAPGQNAFTSYTELQKVERRRSKLSVNESEYAAGISERLCPSMPRIPVLHEIHFSDAVVREVDSAVYFSLTSNGHPHGASRAQVQVEGLQEDLSASPPSSASPPEHQVPDTDGYEMETDSTPVDQSVLLTEEQASTGLGGEEVGGLVELGSDNEPNPLSEEAFAAFGDEWGGGSQDEQERSRTTFETGRHGDDHTPLISTGDDSTGVPQRMIPFGKETLPDLVQHLRDPPPVSPSHSMEDPHSTLEWDPIANTSLVMYNRPLPPSDCLCLLDFLLYLREQTYIDMPVWLQTVVQTTQAFLQEEKKRKECEGGEEEAFDIDDIGGDTTVKPGLSESLSLNEAREPVTRASPRVLRMEDIIRYLDGAPAPRRGFTEDLVAAASSGSDGEALHRPAFLFTLYLENVSIQNAIGHMCMLFALPLQSFHTRTQSGKMSCSSVRCALAPGCLARHHLLLLNTMRHPGFVIRVSDVYAVPQVRAGVASDVTNFFGALARWQPVYYTEILLRRVSASNLLEDEGDSILGDAVDTKDPRQVIQARLRAIETFGAVHFCLNRDTTLARAASDVIHRYYKSALLHALQRPNPPLAMKQFFQAPNEVTASKARAVSTDATIRAVLKAFLQVKGDWFSTVKRTPYAWRRRWINALRGLIWNQMASKRIRFAHRMLRDQRARDTIAGKESAFDSLATLVNTVLVGDVVVRPEFRQDARRRQLLTLKSDYLMLVTNEEEAAGCTLEDVYLPFLRGVYPEHLFAPEESNHPVMRRSTMMALLQKRSAVALLVGLPPVAQHLLDARSDRSPLLFRRLMIRPLAMSATILEDKPPILATQHHYDACRLLQPDRWSGRYTDSSSRYGTQNTVAAPLAYSTAGKEEEEEQEATRVAELIALPRTLHNEGNQSSSTTESTRYAEHVKAVAPSSSGALIPHAAVLEHSSMGQRLPPGVLPSEFFTPPEPSDYLVVGQTHRFEPDSQHGTRSGTNTTLLESSPLTPKEHLQDRLYTLHIRAVCHSTAVGLSQILREYFILMGVKESEERSGTGGPTLAAGPGKTDSTAAYPYMDDVLQHKIHRLWRELDPETPLLTAEKYCPVCYNRDHDSQEECAEYLWKRQVERRRREQVQRVQSYSTSNEKTGSPKGGATLAVTERAPLASTLRRATEGSNSTPCAHSATRILPSARVRLWMKWEMRRPSRLSKWGVRFTKSSLVLTGLDVPEVVASAKVWSKATTAISTPLSRRSSSSSNAEDLGDERVEMGEEEMDVDVPHLLQCWKTKSSGVVSNATSEEDLRVALLSFLQTVVPSSGVTATTEETSHSSTLLTISKSTVERLRHMLSGTIVQKGATVENNNNGDESVVPLQNCEWKLCFVDEREVHDVKDVAEAFLAFSHRRQVSLVLSTPWISTSDIRVYYTPKSNNMSSTNGSGGGTSVTSFKEDHGKVLIATRLDSNTVASHLQHVVCRDEDLNRKSALPPLPLALFLTIREPLQRNGERKSWGLSIQAHELALSNLQQWVSKALACEGQKSTPAVSIEASSPPPSSLFFTSWADILSRHFDETNPHATLRASSIPKDPPESERDFFHYYVVFRVNNSRVNSIKDIPKYLPPVSATSSLTLELRLREWINPMVEERSTHNLEAMLLHNKMLHTVVEGIKSANELYTHSLPPPKTKREGDKPIQATTEEPRFTTSTPGQRAKEGKDTAGPQEDTVPPPVCRKDVLCVPADQKILPPADLVARSATVAVHRPIPSYLLTSEAASPISPSSLPRWGIRLQKNSVRVLHVEHRNGYHFHVYAYTTSQIRRIERGLRTHYNPQSSSSQDSNQSGSAHSTNSGSQGELNVSQGDARPAAAAAAAPVRVYRTHLYLLLEVNHEPVRDAEGARAALRLASQGGSCPSTAALKKLRYSASGEEVAETCATPGKETTSPASERKEDENTAQETKRQALQCSSSSASSSNPVDGESNTVSAPRSIPEVVLLRILDYPLLRVVLPISRGWGDKSKVSKFSIFSPIGIHVDPDVCIVGLSKNSPVEEALQQHGIADHCSLLRLLERKIDSSQEKDPMLDSHDDVWLTKKLGEVCAVPSLIAPLLAVASALRGSSSPSSSPLAQGGLEPERGQRLDTYDWGKDDDDDDDAEVKAEEKPEGDANGDKKGSDVSKEERTEKGDEAQPIELLKAISVLREKINTVEAELKKCTRVDGIQVLQLEILRHSLDLHFPAADKLIAKQQQGGEQTKVTTPEIPPFSWSALLKDLEEVYHLFRWRVVYAQEAKKSIRSPQDLAEAFAPGVVEETVVLQQCVLV